MVLQFGVAEVATPVNGVSDALAIEGVKNVFVGMR